MLTSEIILRRRNKRVGERQRKKRYSLAPITAKSPRGQPITMAGCSRRMLAPHSPTETTKTICVSLRTAHETLEHLLHM